MRENRLSGSMRGEMRRSLATAIQSVHFAYSTKSILWSRRGGLSPVQKKHFRSRSHEHPDVDTQISYARFNAIGRKTVYERQS